MADAAESPPPLPSKRNSSTAGAEDDIAKKPKLESPETPHDNGNGNGNAPPLDKGKSPVTAADKGKGILVEDDEVENDDASDSDDSSSDGDDFEENGLDSDFDDDPLAEVDLENILPSRTRQRAPVPPGAYLVPPGQDGDDSDDSK